MASFTALNGGSPKAASPINGSIDPKAPHPEDRVNGQPADPKAVASNGPTAQRDTWPDRPPYQFATSQDHESNSHKRKRSNSIEPRREHPPPQPERADDPTSTSQATQPHAESRDPYTPYPDDSRDQNNSWYSQQSREDRGSYDQSQQNSATSPGQTEEQIGETLRRATGQMEGGDYSATSPDSEARNMGLYEGPYTPEQRKDGIVQSDPKKRKRVFSNRTKTGCLTCRRRKKKCDEQKPECQNCIKGGFVCSGYQPQKGNWLKQDQKPQVVNIESKDPNYVPPGPYGMPATNQYGQTVHQPKQNPLPAPYRNQPPLRINPPTQPPIMNSEDDRPTASTIPSASVTSPDNKLSALSSYTPGANVFPTPVSAVPAPTPFSERMPKEYQRVPPLHDLTRSDDAHSHAGPTPQSAAPPHQLPQIQILNPTRNNSPVTNQSNTASSNPQVAAQLALSHSSFPSNARRPTQKEEMLAGRNYYPFDKELVLERERCSAACWRFNNSTNPNNGVSPSERSRLFREILQPRDAIQISPTLASPVTNVGRVGEQVVVEAPFVCDYGYNISIGQSVVIGRNCTVNDVNEVKIGDNCHIGPNVSIYTATLPIDPKKRGGSQGPQMGRPVTIDRDCWIGGGAILLPGVTIGRGATVGAGAIVTKNVPPFTIVVGNPAHVLRGVTSGGES